MYVHKDILIPIIMQTRLLDLQKQSNLDLIYDSIKLI